jgi:hypothetical protein
MEILKELHASLAEAYEASFDNAYKKLECETATREADLRQAEEDRWAAREVAERRIQELQNQVYVLQGELKRYEIDPKDLDLPAEFANLEDEFAPKNIWNNYHDNADQLREILDHKYTTLYTNLQTFSRSWTSLKAKVLQHKKKLRHWERQLQRDEFTLVPNGEPITFRRVPNVETGATAKSTGPASKARPRSEPEATQDSVVGTRTAEPTRSQDCAARAKRTVKIEEDSQPVNPGNQTESRRATWDSLSSESSSDIPPPLPDLQSLKRKRVSSASHAHPRESGPERPVLVKNEAASSSPMPHSAYSLGQHLPSTQDLDEIGDTVQTPTKRNAHREVHWEDSIMEDESSGTGTQQTQSDRPFQQPSVLCPVDGNARKNKGPRQESGSKKQKLTDHRAILSMAEDGDAGGHGVDSRGHLPRNTPAPHTGPSQSKDDGKATQNRLQGLLERPLPSKSPLRSAKDFGGPDTSQGPSKTATSRRHLITTESPSSQKQSYDSASETGSQKFLGVRPEEEPYRSLPLSRLNLDHFKINPTRNQGLDFAYDAVVRKRDDRKCISGCTRPGCCGDRFRAMARVGGLPANTFAEQTEEDQRILEEYVGEDRHLLGGLSGQDRDNLLVEARARILANQYGRHRHTHQRARSPPGFWRTDMPDTQERESDREAAQRLEREKVEERYREAMRPGGLWTWADE